MKLLLSLLIFSVVAGSVGYLAYRGIQGAVDNQTAAVRAALSDNATPLPANFNFEIADTPAKQVQGLSGRTDVPHNYGMLFVFPTPSKYGFWMKDMDVPIDIIWLSDKGEIIQILDSVATSTYPSVFYPPQAIRYVLETRAGEAAAQGWRAGSTVKLP